MHRVEVRYSTWFADQRRVVQWSARQLLLMQTTLHILHSTFYIVQHCTLYILHCTTLYILAMGRRVFTSETIIAMQLPNHLFL